MTITICEWIGPTYPFRDRSFAISFLYLWLTAIHFNVVPYHLSMQNRGAALFAARICCSNWCCTMPTLNFIPLWEWMWCHKKFLHAHQHFSHIILKSHEHLLTNWQQLPHATLQTCLAQNMQWHTYKAFHRASLWSTQQQIWLSWMEANFIDSPLMITECDVHFVAFDFVQVPDDNVAVGCTSCKQFIWNETNHK